MSFDLYNYFSELKIIPDANNFLFCAHFSLSIKTICVCFSSLLVGLRDCGSFQDIVSTIDKSHLRFKLKYLAISCFIAILRNFHMILLTDNVLLFKKHIQIDLQINDITNHQ